MTDEDMFFTTTIVGSALSLPLGDIPPKQARYDDGLQVGMLSGRRSLTTSWLDWLEIQGSYPYIGQPRRRPGALRRWVERYALFIAGLGVVLSILAVVTELWSHILNPLISYLSAL
jgi:hypothetical protein